MSFDNKYRERRAMKLSFGEIERTLQLAHGVSDERAPQFRARLRNLMRSDRGNIALPSGGRGRRANYDPADLFKLGFTLELLQAGITPERAAISVAQHWPDLVEQIFMVRKSIQDGHPVWHYLTSEPATLINDFHRFARVDGAALAKQLSTNAALGVPRLLVINAGAMLMNITRAAAEAGLNMEALSENLDAAQSIILERGARVGPRLSSGFVEGDGGA